MIDKNDILNQIKRIKALSEDIEDYRSIDTGRAYERVDRRISKQTRQIYWQYASRIAAILLLPLLISTLVVSYLYIEQKNELAKIAYNEVTSAPGTVTRLELPDHSIVWLNAESRLSYPTVFNGREREVKLSGEGYFEVQSDREHPFYVSTDGGLKVMAYGTKFNVNAYQSEPVIEAVLERGKIDVISENKRIQLEPNKQASFDKTTGVFTVSAINMDEKTGWKEGRLVFRNAPLEVVLQRLSRRYNVDIALHKKGDKTYNYRATFTTETIEQILNYLKLTAPIEWSIRQIEQKEDTSFRKEHIDVYLR